MNTSVDNIYREPYCITSSTEWATANFSFNDISEVNIMAIKLVKSYASLRDNWDSYGAGAPSSQAIQKAITFILWLSEYKIDVFFTAPSPSGEILVEIKNGIANLEFEFSNDSKDTVCASLNDGLKSEASLNDATRISYLKWLICPDGNCPSNS